MKLKIAQVIGLNSDQRAALVLSESTDPESPFISVLELSSDDAFTKGRQILSDLAQGYFESDGSPAEKLNETFKSALKKLESIDNFDIVIGAICGKALYLVGKGNVEVLLKRNSKMSPLLAVGSGNQLISGFLKEGDRLLLSTKNLISFLSKDLGVVLDLKVEDFEEDISNRLGAANLEDQGLAGLLVEVCEEKDIQHESSEKEVNTSSEGNEERKTKTISINFEFIPKIFKALLKVLPKGKERQEYVDYEEKKNPLSKFFPKSGRSRLFLALILIIIIGISIGFKVTDDKNKEKIRQLNAHLQQAKDDFEAAKNLKDLNPQDTKAKLESAKSGAEKALTINPKSVEALDLKNQIAKDTDSILKQFSAGNFPEFLDLELIKKNFRADKMSLSDGKLLLLDPSLKTLVTIDMEKKSQSIIAGSSQLGDSLIASINSGFGFTYSKDKGIIRTDINNQKQTIVAKKGADLPDIVDMAGFASNVYVLDSENPPAGGKIWKYVATASGFSDKREYLNSGVSADFKGAVRMQIESSIYILKSDGEMLRFTKGNKDTFSYSGLPSNIKEPKSFFVSSDTDNLYILDSGNSRLLVLSKTGEYKAQYQGEKFATASDLVVDEVGKKVYLLDGGKIYTTDLK